MSKNQSKESVQDLYTEDYRTFLGDTEDLTNGER